MKCSSKSTTWRASLAALACLCCTTAAEARDAAGELRVREAVIAAVRARMVADTVTVQQVRWEVAAGQLVSQARPEPGARLNQPARFTLTDGNRNVGYAIATVSVVAPHVRVIADAGREPLRPENLVLQVGNPGGVLVQALPTMADASGAEPARALKRGDVITFAVLRRRMAVAGGDRVEVRAVIGALEAIGHAVALQSGRVGDTIRIINPDSRRELRGRIVGPGQIEVRHER